MKRPPELAAFVIQGNLLSRKRSYKRAALVMQSP